MHVTIIKKHISFIIIILYKIIKGVASGHSWWHIE